MNKKEIIINGAGFLLTSAICGGGFLLKDHAVVSNFILPAGINLFSAVIQKGYVHMGRQWVASDNGLLNHDIQRALMRSLLKAIDNIKADFISTRKIPDVYGGHKGIEKLFDELSEHIKSSGPAEFKNYFEEKTLIELIDSPQEVATDLLWEKFQCDDIFPAEIPGLRKYFRNRLPSVLQGYFIEELKNDNKDSNKAWRAFQLLLNQGLRAELSDLKTGQTEIQAELKKLDQIQDVLNKLNNRTEKRLSISEEPFLQGLFDAGKIISDRLARIEQLMSDLKTPVNETNENVKTILNKISEGEVLIEGGVLPKGIQLLNDYLPNSHTQPSILRKCDTFVDRDFELAALKKSISSGKIVIISGAEGSGKRELIAQYFNDAGELEDLKRKLRTDKINLLILDLSGSIGPYSALRALASSLGCSEFDSLDDVKWDEDTSKKKSTAKLFSEVLPQQLNNHVPITIIENTRIPITHSLIARDLVNILNHYCIAAGSVIISSQDGMLPKGVREMLLSDIIKLEPLPVEAAQELLGICIGDRLIAISAIAEAKSISTTRLPAVLRGAANQFKCCVDAGDEAATSDLLFQCVIDSAEDLMKSILSKVRLDVETEKHTGSPKPLNVLMLMAILSKLPIGPELLENTHVDSSALPVAGESDLIHISAGKLRLTRLGTWALRDYLRLLFTGPERSQIIDRLSEQLKPIVTQIIGMHEGGGLQTDIKESIEEAIAWLNGISEDTGALKDVLLKALLPLSVCDRFYPISAAESADLSEKIKGSDDSDLPNCLMNLSNATRFEFDQREFLKILKLALAAAKKSQALWGHQVELLDNSAFIGQRRFHCDREMWIIRREFLPILMENLQKSNSDIGLRKWTISWTLNTIRATIFIGESTHLEESLKALDKLMAEWESEIKNSSLIDWFALDYRRLNLKAQIAQNRFERLEFNKAAFQTAKDGFLKSNGMLRWLWYYIRAICRLQAELQSYEERNDCLQSSMIVLEQMYGARHGWPLPLRLAVVTIYNAMAEIEEEPRVRIELAEHIENLILPRIDEVNSAARAGDPTAILKLAEARITAGKAYKELEKYEAAQKKFESANADLKRSLRLQPTSEAWELKLKSAAESADLTRTSPFISQYEATRTNMKEVSELVKCIHDCEEWLEDFKVWGKVENNLALICFQYERRIQGGYEGMLAERAKQQNVDFDLITPPEKLKLLRSLHIKRMGNLSFIEKKSGPSVSVYLAKIRLEVEYQRISAYYSNNKMDESAIERYFEATSALWPDNYFVRLERARFYRYIWDFEKAAEIYRGVIMSIPRSLHRREALIEFAEILLSSVKSDGMNEGEERQSIERARILDEAIKIVEEIKCFEHISKDAAILRDRIEFEMGLPVDWTEIERVYEAIIGDVDLYTRKVIEYLNHRPGAEKSLLEHLADAVRQNCTSQEVLHEMGVMFLRKAETNYGEDPVSDCRKAYSIFQACGILDKAYNKAERPVTSYLRARAITYAAMISRSTNPFSADCEGKPTLLHLASAKLDSASSRSIGRFHGVVVNRKKVTTKLISELTK